MLLFVYWARFIGFVSDIVDARASLSFDWWPGTVCGLEKTPDVMCVGGTPGDMIFHRPFNRAFHSGGP